MSQSAKLTYEQYLEERDTFDRSGWVGQKVRGNVRELPRQIRKQEAWEDSSDDES